MKTHRTNRIRKYFRPSVTSLEARSLLSGMSPTPAAGPAAAGGTDVLTYHNDTSRTGANLNETTLTPQNVNASSFGKLFSYKVDGQVYAQPLEVSQVRMSDGKVHNVLIVATENDSVYALDANDPTAGPRHDGVLWQNSFIDPAKGITPVPAQDVENNGVGPTYGITATPVIDRATETIYVVEPGEGATDRRGRAALRAAIPRPEPRQRQGEGRRPGHDRRHHAPPRRQLHQRHRALRPRHRRRVGRRGGQVQRAAAAPPDGLGARHERAGASRRRRLHGLCLGWRYRPVPRLAHRLRREDPEDRHHLQLHPEWRLRGDLAVRSGPLGRVQRRPDPRDRQRYVRRLHHDDPTRPGRAGRGRLRPRFQRDPPERGRQLRRLHTEHRRQLDGPVLQRRHPHRPAARARRQPAAAPGPASTSRQGPRTPTDRTPSRRPSRISGTTLSETITDQTTGASFSRDYHERGPPHQRRRRHRLRRLRRRHRRPEGDPGDHELDLLQRRPDPHRPLRRLRQQRRPDGHRGRDLQRRRGRPDHR